MKSAAGGRVPARAARGAGACADVRVARGARTAPRAAALPDDFMKALRSVFDYRWAARGAAGTPAGSCLPATPPQRARGSSGPVAVGPLAPGPPDASLAPPLAHCRAPPARGRPRARASGGCSSTSTPARPTASCAARRARAARVRPRAGTGGKCRCGAGHGPAAACRCSRERASPRRPFRALHSHCAPADAGAAVTPESMRVLQDRVSQLRSGSPGPEAPEASGVGAGSGSGSTSSGSPLASEAGEAARSFSDADDDELTFALNRRISEIATATGEWGTDGLDEAEMRKPLTGEVRRFGGWWGEGVRGAEGEAGRAPLAQGDWTLAEWALAKGLAPLPPFAPAGGAAAADDQVRAAVRHELRQAQHPGQDLRVSASGCPARERAAGCGTPAGQLAGRPRSAAAPARALTPAPSSPPPPPGARPAARST
jgi:hypothetical protein